VDVHAKLAEIRRAVEDARSMPMSASAVVNRGEMLTMLDDLAAALDAAFTDAQRVLSERDAVLDQGRSEAAQIVAEAKNEREHIISDTEVYRVAKRQAEHVLEQAQAESAELRKETDDYVDAMLANFEITLERTMEAVKRGRERLAGRSALDSLTAEEAEKIKLPEHLEG
jgi:cell division septum initiation protein DivIVA